MPRAATVVAIVASMQLRALRPVPKFQRVLTDKCPSLSALKFPPRCITSLSQKLLIGRSPFIARNSSSYTLEPCPRPLISE